MSRTGKTVGKKIATFMLVAILSASSTWAQSGFDLFQKAILKERAEGDIEAAMAMLERVVKDFSSDRALAARALLQLGIYSEKLRKAQATRYYDSLISDYPEQRAEVSQARQRRDALSAHHLQSHIVEKKLLDDPLWHPDNAAISLDGTHLVFADTDRTLAIRNLKTGRSYSLTHRDKGLARSPIISPDLNRLAYLWENIEDGRYELRITNLTGTETRVLVASADQRYQPRGWSPHGQLLVSITGKSGGTQIVTIDESTGSIRYLKAFLGPSEPRNAVLSPDGRFVAYDFPVTGEEARGIFVLSTQGGFEEFTVGHSPADVSVLGWPDGKWLLFAGELKAKRGIWAQETLKGKPTGLDPILVRTLPPEDKEVRALGTTRTGSLVFTPGLKHEIRALEGILPELARLQLGALQQPQQQSAAIEGVVTKLGSNEPISGADVELTRLEGTESSPLAPGAAAAFEAAFRNPPQISGLQPPAEIAALQPEVRLAQTGSDGRYTFRNLKPGKYRIAAIRIGGAYHPAEYGQRDPRGRGTPLSVATGQVLRDIRLELAATGVITGRVVDGDGAPVVRASVRAAEVAYVNGERVLRTQQSVVTDDRGEYRLFWLPPGVYYVGVKAEHPDRANMRVLITSPGATGGMLQSEEVLITRRTLPDGDLAEEIQRLVYFGNTVDAARSRPIDLRSGGTFAGADITIEIGRTLSRKIRGVIVNGITGKPAAGTTIRAISMEASLSRRVSLTVADNEGAFEVSGISPGSYLLFSPYVRDLSAGAAVQPQNPESIAMVTVEAGSSNLENVRLVLLPPVAVPGRVTSEGRPITASDLSRIRVTLSRDITLGIPAIAPPSVASRQGVVDGSGAFALWAPPGNFRVEVQGIPPNTYVKSAFLGGKDVLGGGLKIESSNTNPLEVVLANATAEVSGTVINGRLDPVVNALVVLVPGPTDLRSRADLYITTTTDATGRFRLRAVPPGNYKLFAWNYVEPEIWLNREFLRAHESAGKTIEVGQSVTEGIQVTLTPRAEGVQQ